MKCSDRTVRTWGGNATGSVAVAGSTAVGGSTATAGATPGAKPADDAKGTTAQLKAPQPDPTRSQPPLAADKSVSPEGPAVKKGAARRDNVAKADDAASGTLEFWISPWGDVFVDGKQVGTSPPLRVYKLPAGTHKVEVYNDNAGFPHSETVVVQANEVKRINKSFPGAR